MGGGGKTAQTSSQVTIPPEVLARYNAVNARAETAAQEPFQQYSQDPNAFVAPINQQQQAGIQSVNNAAGAWQPYFQAATDAANSSVTGAMPWMGAAGQTINNANAQGQYQTQAAYNPLMGGQQAAAGLNAAAGNAYGSSYAASQPFMGQAAGLIGQGYSSAQPFNMGAAGLALQGGQAVNPSQLNSQAINQYMNPYLSTVMQGTLDPMRQQQQQQMSAMQGNQIMQGAFGGDRANIGQAVLGQQQNLALGQAAAGILQPAYESALGTAGQQQQLGLSAEQANRAATQSTSDRLAGLGQQVYGQGVGAGQAYAGLGQAQFGMGQQYGQSLQGLGQQVFGQGAQTSEQQAALAQQMYGMGANTSQIQQALGQGIFGIGQGYSGNLQQLGQGAQAAGLAGGQAQLGAGTLQQQTSQAGLSALYNQFQQQQGYPFQVAQFLANIAEGTGALSGSTTTSTSPASSFLSDERAKEDIEPIGKTFDGQNIIKFRYKGHPGKQIGLSAQETEHHHPRAVGLDASGLKTVDYDEATKGAAERGHFYEGGLVAAGGAVNDNNAYERYAAGGMPGFDMNAILQSQMGMYAPQGGPVPGLGGAGGYGAGIAGTPSTHTLKTVDAPKYKAPTLKDAADTLESGQKIYEGGKKAYGKIDEMINGPANQYDGSSGTPMDFEGDLNPRDFDDGLGAENFDDHDFWARGGLVAHKADGGEVPSDVSTNYPLSDTYANYMAQQRMHPFSGMGIYGNPLITAGVGGPYATMLEGRDTNRHILNAPAPEARQYENKDASEDSYQRLVKMTGAKGKKKEEDKPEGHASGGRSNFDVGGYVTSPGGYVPQPMENKQQELASADPVKAPKDSTMSDIADVAKIAMMFVNRGGRIKRAMGGVNMSMPGSMGYVPEQTQPTPELMQASAPKGAGGDDSLTQAIGIASKFLAGGGRAGFKFGSNVDDSGAPDEGEVYNNSDPVGFKAGLSSLWDAAKGVGRDVVKNIGDESARADWRQTQGPQADHPADLPVMHAPAGPVRTAPPAPPPARSAGLGQRYTPPHEQVMPPGTQLPPLSGSGVNVPPRPTPQPLQEGPAPAAPGLVAPPTVPPEATAAAPTPQPGLGQRIGDTISSGYDAIRGLDAGKGHVAGASPQRGGESDFLSRNQDWMVPLIKGIGAASLYPGKSVIGASLYGLSKGAESYEDTQNQLAERELTSAESGVSRQQANVLTAEEAAKYANMYPGKMPVKVNGQIRFIPITDLGGAQDAKGRFVSGGANTIGASGMGQMKYLGDAGRAQATMDAGDYIIAAKDPTFAANSQAFQRRAYDEGSAAAANNPRILMTANSIAANSTGALQPGALQPMLRDVASTWNSIIDRFVKNPADRAKYEFASNQELTDALIADKMSKQNLADFAHMGGQDNLGALQMLANAVPHTGMTREAALDLSSVMMMNNQRAIDKQQYFNEYGHLAKAAGAMSTASYSGQNADRAFASEKEYSPQQYAKEQQLLRRVLESPSMMSKLQSTDDKVREQAYEAVNRFSPGLSRYFTGYR